MNSEQRHEQRYQRRKSKRKPNNLTYPYEEVFTFEHLWKAHITCMHGVMWKASVQKYNNLAISNIAKTYHELHNGKYKSRGFYEFDIIDRGKHRHIKSIHISERVVQRCLCDYSLTAQLSRQLIYDNGACLKGKGIDFSLNRLDMHLNRYYKQNKTNEGYALVFDFSKFFDSIDHARLIEVLHSVIKDRRTMMLL